MTVTFTSMGGKFYEFPHVAHISEIGGHTYEILQTRPFTGERIKTRIVEVCSISIQTMEDLRA
jgi:hypothetical protein